MTAEPTTILAALRTLRQLLDDESAALRSFDLSAIAAIGEAKLELGGALEAATAAIEGGEAQQWNDAERRELAGLQQAIRTVGSANAHRLRASWNAVRGLVEHLTGTPAQGYGRAPVGAPRPVLTADVG